MTRSSSVTSCFAAPERPYYENWLMALEAISAAKQLVTDEERVIYAAAWTHAAGRTPHGEPIALRADDFA
jgi:hypothetical protein